MILLYRHRFGVAGYYRTVNPVQAEERLAQGLVVPVELRFEYWLNDQSLQAEAFLDPGSDNTYVSLRWLKELAEAAKLPGLMPLAGTMGDLKEAIEISIAGQPLGLGVSDPAWIGTQGEVIEGLFEMPGCEDLILGRDFITQHGLLLLIDGREGSMSLLLPSDGDNLRRREQIQKAFDPKQRVEQ